MELDGIASVKIGLSRYRIEQYGIYEDISGQAIIDTLNDYLTGEWKPCLSGNS